MLKKLDAKNMFLSNLGWLKSRFHFSFAEYRNFSNMNFGVLRVLNDDLVDAREGFGTHPHKNMEIISYVVNGKLTHQDSMGNKETLTKGEVQYMSAGTGITHSEMNESDEKLRFLQIWIIPPKENTKPIYGSHRFREEERVNKLLNIVSSQSSDAVIKVHQDIKIFVSQLDSNKEINVNIPKDRQIYFIQIEGSSSINGVELNEADAIEITEESKFNVKALCQSHFLFIEMPIEKER